MNKPILIHKIIDMLVKFTPRILKATNQPLNNGWHKVQYVVYYEDNKITRISDIKLIYGLKPESEGYNVAR